MHVCAYDYMGTCVCATNMHAHMGRCVHVFTCVGRAEVDIKTLAQYVLPGLMRHFLSLHVKLIASMRLVSQRAPGICQSLCHSNNGVAGTCCHISFFMNDGDLNTGPHSVHICLWPRAFLRQVTPGLFTIVKGKELHLQEMQCADIQLP